MADTAIAITAGAGTNVDTRTEATNGNHRQVIVIGDPATNAGVAPVDVTKGLAVDLTNTGANTNKLLVTPDLPTGAATAAKQLADGHKVAIDNLDVALSTRLKPADTLAGVTTVGTITNAVAVTNAGITTIAAAVSTEMQCDIVGALPAGTALIGKVGVQVSATRVQGKVDNADTTTAREVLAAVASNYVYITSFVISVAAAGNYWLEDADAAQLTPKFYLAANGGVSWTAVGDTPYRTTTVNKAINVKGSTAGAVGVMLTGYTATA